VPRNPRPSTALAALLPWLAFVGACLPDEPFVGRVDRSELFAYHTQGSEPLCPGVLPLLDRHARVTSARLGLELDPADAPFRYYQFESAQALEDSGVCPTTTHCEHGEAVYSTAPFFAHELAHAYVERAWGTYPVGLLAEGVAVALSCQPTLSRALALDEQPEIADWREVLYTSGSDNSLEYLAGGALVTLLASRYGWSSVGALFQRTPAGVSAADFEHEFASVFPISMDEAWADALRGGESPPCFQAWTCDDATPMTLGDTATIGCDGESHRSLSPVAQTGFVFTVRGSAMAMVDCSRAARVHLFSDPSVASGPLEAIHWATLAPGTYAVAQLVLMPDGQLTWVGETARPILTDACGAGETVRLDPVVPTVVDFSRGAATGWIRLAGGNRPYLVEHANIVPSDGFLTMLLSDACGALPHSIVNGQVASVGDDAVLHIVAGADSPAFSEWGQLTLTPLDTQEGP
jgi:hypothetical protein